MTRKDTEKIVKLLYEDLTYKIIGAAYEVHKELGPGYLESVYEDALCYELDKNNAPYQRQVELDIRYKETVFERKFRADVLVDAKVLVENKVIKPLMKQDEAQLLNYLKITSPRVGLLFIFGSTPLEKIRMVLKKSVYFCENPWLNILRIL